MNAENSQIAIVVPYHQATPGLLNRALTSAAAQPMFATDCVVIVVDDGSPIPASEELAGLSDDVRDRVRVITQTNSGPSSARNTGLANVPSGVDYVAFLDSDDWWSEDHLERAVSILSQGYDFYLSDGTEHGEEHICYRRIISKIEHLFVPSSSVDECLVTDRNMLSELVIYGNFVLTPTVVLRWAKFHDLRFVEELSVAEDRTYWCDILARTNMIAFSKHDECNIGKGVNIYRSITYGSERSVSMYIDMVVALKRTQTSYVLTGEARRHLKEGVFRRRQGIVLALLHMIRRGQFISLPVIKRVLKVDPVTLPEFLPIAAGILVRKVLGRMGDTND